MRKIINGKRYDTDTATFIGSESNGRYYNDFSYLNEELYKTKKGAFFLHCEGGPMTRYCTHAGNEYSWGETIQSLTEEEAKTWAEQHCMVDVYEANFGPCEEA